MPDGRNFESTPELVLEPVPITDLEVNYKSELEFRDSFGGIFVPGHEALISLEDPIADKNYYYWTYRTYENLDFCQKCDESIFRDGDCLIVGDAITGFPYFFYPCETDCWRIRYPESIAIFDDEFSNGKSITQVPVGNLLLYSKENMVLEVRQLSLTPAAYDYYKVLKDIVDNSSGLNAPPPAALIGNLFNSKDTEDFIFGRFTAAATTTAAIFIDRSKLLETPLEFDSRQPDFEPSFMSPFPPPVTINVPCLETPNTTVGQFI